MMGMHARHSSHPSSRYHPLSLFLFPEISDAGDFSEILWGSTVETDFIKVKKERMYFFCII